MVKLWIVILCILFSKFFYAQTITGIIKDEDQNILLNAYVKIYSADSTKSLIKYFAIYNGAFNITIDKNEKSVLINVSSNGYEPKDILIKTLETKNVVITLKRTKIQIENIVEVRAKPNPITLKNDTTTYKLNFFKDGTERKLDEILKKLPGIDVNEKTGEIKFKGKPIETILLEGDNLFASNYTIASKNINADVVEEVQAIENYSDNYVLKDLDKIEKIALNLKLKKSGTKISGNIDIGNGVFDKGNLLIDYSANAIGISSVHKFFATFNFNNTGINKSNIDYINNNTTLEQQREKQFFAEKFIPESSFSSLLNIGRTNLNKQVFVNYNGLLKISKKSSVKINFYQTNDKLESIQQLQNSYITINDTIKTFDNFVNTKKPNSTRVDIYLRNNISRKALLEYTTIYRKELINTTKINNNNLIQLYTSDYIQKHNVLFSQRINSKNALQISLTYVNNYLSQALNNSPSLFNKIRYSNDEQLNLYKKSNIHIQTTLLGKYNKLNYLFHYKYSNSNNDIEAFIKNDSNNREVKSFPSKIHYSKNLHQHYGNLNWKLYKLKISTAYTISLLNQELVDIINDKLLKKINVLIEPNINLSYTLSKYSKIINTYSFTQKPNVERHSFNNYMLQSNRNVVLNTLNLELEKSYQTNLTFFRNDLYNQFDFSLGTNLQKNIGEYLPEVTLTDTILYTRYFFKAVNNNSMEVFLNSTKYFSKMLSTIKLSFSYNRSSYNNLVNSNTLRKNTNTNNNYELLYKTAFRKKINFENNLSYVVNVAQNEDFGKYRIISVQNNFKVIVKTTKKTIAYYVLDYFLPSTKISKNYNFFLDFYLNYKPKNKKIEYRLIGKNLLNNKSFNTYQVSDFSESIYKTNIINRNIGFYFSYIF